MEHQFWHDKWRNNEIGFHQHNTNPWLIKHLDALRVAEHSRLFLPLCGKTRDIDWLLNQGFQVATCELNESAVKQLFKRLEVSPGIEHTDSFSLYRSEQLEVWVGDVFALTADMLGSVDAVFDRAALVALPREMRSTYASHLANITAHAPQLLVCFEYSQEALNGPPFAVLADEVRTLYEHAYNLTELSSADVPGGLKGHCPAQEVCWLLE
jgi:thiopurine S-methyltransferase